MCNLSWMRSASALSGIAEIKGSLDSQTDVLVIFSFVVVAVSIGADETADGTDTVDFRRRFNPSRNADSNSARFFDAASIESGGGARFTTPIQSQPGEDARFESRSTC